LFGHVIFVEALNSMIKPIPAGKPVTFGTLGPTPLDQTSKDLAKEAKKLNNKEKGYEADERYLGEQQNLQEKFRRFAKTGEGPWDDVDYYEANYLNDDIPW
jgi:hypothetical protein